MNSKAIRRKATALALALLMAASVLPIGLLPAFAKEAATTEVQSAGQGSDAQATGYEPGQTAGVVLPPQAEQRGTPADGQGTTPAQPGHPGAFDQTCAPFKALAVATTRSQDITVLATQNAVSYVDAAGVAQTPQDATIVESQTAWDTSENNGWYVVNNTVTISDRITVTGTVNLILADTGNLTAGKGITVADNNSLTIWAQSGGTGQLHATGELDSQHSMNGAGIGSDYHQSCGTITINGGMVYAQGVPYAAAIGCGNSGHGGTITINSGTVNAQGSDDEGSSAGIGGGQNFVGDFTITINGGTVEAQGTQFAAGIGSTRSGGGGTIIINDGMVMASGGAFGAGIGYGSDGVNRGANYAGDVTINGGTVEAQGGRGGAGIGGATYSTGSEVTISGGTVTATGGSGGGGIGSGLFGEADMITISGGTVTATGGLVGKDIGPGYNGSDGTITITGGSVNATQRIVSPQPTNGSADVYLNTLTIGSAANASKRITAASVKGVPCATTPNAASGVYGINDVETSSTGAVYFWLPVSSNGGTDKECVTTTISGGSDVYEYTYARTASAIIKTLVIKIDPTLYWPTALTMTYGESLGDITLPANTGASATPGTFSWADDTIGPAVSDSNTTNYTLIFTPDDTDLYHTTQNTTVKVTVSKAAGATVAAPTKQDSAATSVTLNAVSAPTTGQTVEYAKNTTDSAPSTGWQDALSFNNLSPCTTYYFFARAKESSNYYAGAASSSLSITTEKEDQTTSAALPRFAHRVIEHFGTFTGNGTSSLPGTGERTDRFVWALLLVISGTTMIAISLLRRRTARELQPRRLHAKK